MSGERLRDRLAEIINDWVQGNWTYDSEVERSFAATPAAWSLAEALLPVIATHVAAETETLRADVERVWRTWADATERMNSRLQGDRNRILARADDAEWRLALMRADRDAQAARADDAERRVAAVEAVCAEMENLAEHGAFIHNDPYECTIRLRAALDPEADR